MTSKEALEIIKNTKTNIVKYSGITPPLKLYSIKEFRKNEIKTIKQDLERLQQLEYENASLKIKVRAWEIQGEKLKKVVNIFKYKIVNVDILRDCDTVAEYNEFGLSNLSQQEYDLLKEVLE